jgi:hypothetical protein
LFGAALRLSAPQFDLDQSWLIRSPNYVAVMSQPISTAPYGRDLELAVIDRDREHAPIRISSAGKGRIKSRGLGLSREAIDPERTPCIEGFVRARRVRPNFRF